MKKALRDYWEPIAWLALLSVAIGMLCGCEERRAIPFRPTGSETPICGRHSPPDDTTACPGWDWSSGQIAPYNAASKLGVMNVTVLAGFADSLFPVSGGMIEIAPETDAHFREWDLWRLWQNDRYTCPIYSCDSTGCDTTLHPNWKDLRLEAHKRYPWIVNGFVRVSGLPNGYPAGCGTSWLLAYGPTAWDLPGAPPSSRKTSTYRARLVGRVRFSGLTQRETVDVVVRAYPLSQPPAAP